jgi:hypothetical protein
MLTSSRIRSLAQWTLHDPSLYAIENDMTAAETSLIDLEMISELVAQSEIDFRSLKNNIIEALQEHAQVSIADVLRLFPAAQGLGSIIGYFALGSRHGLMAEHSEIVRWSGNDGEDRSAHIPIIYFMRDRSHELE